MALATSFTASAGELSLLARVYLDPTAGLVFPITEAQDTTIAHLIARRIAQSGEGGRDTLAPEYSDAATAVAMPRFALKTCVRIGQNDIESRSFVGTWTNAVELTLVGDDLINVEVFRLELTRRVVEFLKLSPRGPFKETRMRLKYGTIANAIASAGDPEIGPPILSDAIAHYQHRADFFARIWENDQTTALSVQWLDCGSRGLWLVESDVDPLSEEDPEPGSEVELRHVSFTSLLRETLGQLPW